MAYFAPYIDSTGLHIPPYADIKAYLIQGYQGIYGNDIYLGDDDANGQELGIFALIISDAMQGLQAVYNNRGPSGAVGTALDSIIQLNGMERDSASYSTCSVTLTGTPEAELTGLTLTDVNGYNWDVTSLPGQPSNEEFTSLPSSVTIGSGGTLVTTAVCETIGAITATAGQINIIATPQNGLTSVTNVGSATAGSPVETDSHVRARQAISVALPSQTRLAGTIAAIAALPGVNRYLVLENPTGSTGTDPNGLSLPAHSITAIVDGGTIAEIAQAIYNNRGIGCYTNNSFLGTGIAESYVITDPNYGTTTTINFIIVQYVPIYVTVTLKKLTGYSTVILTQVQAAIINYLNSLQIYERVSWTSLIAAAYSVLPNLAQPSFAIETLTLGTAFGSQSAADVTPLYYQVAQGLSGNDGSSNPYVSVTQTS